MVSGTSAISYVLFLVFPAAISIIGAAKTAFRPSFCPIVKMAIDKSLCLAFRPVTYFNYIL